MAVNRKDIYEFGPFRLDAAERLLLRRGEAVLLTPKAFDVLLALVEQPGHLIEKETLFKTVWPDSFVEDNSLADNISRLRKALGEGEKAHKFIETVPKRGYRFVAPVTKVNDVEAMPRLAGAAPPVGLTVQPTAPTLRARWRVRFTAVLRVAALVAPLLIGFGLWLNFRLDKSAEVRRLEFMGNFYLGRWTEDEIRKGMEYYNRAAALDPGSASAQAGIATGWNFLSDLHVAPREAMPRSKASASKALQIDDSLATAHTALGVSKMQYDWDWAGAEQEFRRAIALDPGNGPAHQLYGWYLIAMGRFDEARAEMQRAQGNDPLNAFGLWGLGDSFYFARNYDQAIEQYRRAIGLEPRSHWPHMLLGWTLAQQRRFEEAIDELRQAYRLNDNPQVLASLGHAYAVSGQHAEALKTLAQLRETAGRRYISPYDVATIHAGLGDKEQTLAWLQMAYEHRCGWLAWWLKVDPKFDIVRADPRFGNLLRRVGHAEEDINVPRGMLSQPGDVQAVLTVSGTSRTSGE